MTLDAAIVSLAIAVAAIGLIDLVATVHHWRAARSRRAPVILLGTRSDER